MFVLLDAEQQRELTHYVLTRNEQDCASAENSYAISHASTLQTDVELPLTEIQEGDLYFCLEERKVCIGNQKIELTAKEFDALHLLIINRKRVLTFETLACQIWGEEYVDITTKTIHNLMSRVRHKLQVSPDTYNYIVRVRGVGYKFDAGI